MNTAYWLAIVWGLLTVVALLFTNGRNVALVSLLATAAILSSLLGVAISYNLL